MPLHPVAVLATVVAAIGLQYILTEHRALTQQLFPEFSTADFSAAALTVRRLLGLREGGEGQYYKKAGWDTGTEVQPDEIRQRDVPVSETDPTMRCFEALPPWSMVVVSDIEIYVESFFQQQYEGGYAFKYHGVWRGIFCTGGSLPPVLAHSLTCYVRGTAQSSSRTQGRIRCRCCPAIGFSRMRTATYTRSRALARWAPRQRLNPGARGATTQARRSPRPRVLSPALSNLRCYGCVSK